METVKINGWLLVAWIPCLAFYFLNVAAGATSSDQCTLPNDNPIYNYSLVLHQSRDKGLAFDDLPGFTRSVYYSDHAVITPESRVWSTLHGWEGVETAHLISGASGANFVMYLARFKSSGAAPMPESDRERFVFVLEGSMSVMGAELDAPVNLKENDFAYLPPDFNHRLESAHGAGAIIYERKYVAIQEAGPPKFLYGNTDDQPILDAPGEVFVLRKLLPQSAEFTFNIHIMDFKPGEHLFVKEVHYNQHGLMILQGKGIYRLADNWYPVQAGDAIWMAPFVPQWYGALGYENTRYIIYKDTRPPTS